MATWLKQSTAVEIKIGPFVDETDGKTAETALTISQADVRLAKNGGDWAQKNEATTLVHEENGWYRCLLDTTDTGTLGILMVAVHESGALPVWREFVVLPAMIYDSLVAGSDRLDTNVTHIGDTAQTARDIGASVLLSSGTGTGQLDFTSGVVKANVTQFNGSNATSSSGRPEVNTSHWGGTAVGSTEVRANLINIAGSAVNTSSAQLGVNVVNAAGTAWGSGAITAGAIASDAITAAKIADGAIDRATFAADTGLQSIRSNTAQAGASTTITLDASASSTTDFYKHDLIYLTGGTGAGQYRICTAYNGTTKVATVTPAWATNPSSDSTFAVVPRGIANMEAIGGAALSTSTAQIGVNLVNIAGSAVNTSSAQLGVNVVNAAGTAWNSGAIGASTLASDTIAATKIATGAITSAKFAAGAIDAAAIANNAIDAATFAADVDAEFLSYLVDDATRIDVSALNTLSSHDPGETIMGATDLGTGSGLTSLATAAELAKVPKSDSNVTWNATAAAQIQSEVNDAIVANGLDHLVGASVAGSDVADNSIIAKMVSKSSTADWDSYVNTTDALEAIRDRGDAAWITATGFSTHSAADVWAVGTRTLTTLDEDSTTLDLDATIRAAIGLASANLDTQLADLPTVAEFEARTLLAAAYGTAANQATIIGYIDTEVAAIKAKTDQLTFTTANKIDAKLTSDGLDNIVATTPNGVASTFATKIMQLWARFFGRVTKDSDEIKTYRSDGTTVATTQTYTSSGSDDDVGAAT